MTDNTEAACNCAPGIDGLIVHNSWAHPERATRPVITDEMVEAAAHKAYQAGAGAFANMFVIKRWMRVALEAVFGENHQSTDEES